MRDDDHRDRHAGQHTLPTTLGTAALFQEHHDGQHDAMNSTATHIVEACSAMPTITRPLPSACTMKLYKETLLELPKHTTILPSPP